MFAGGLGRWGLINCARLRKRPTAQFISWRASEGWRRPLVGQPKIPAGQVRVCHLYFMLRINQIEESAQSRCDGRPRLRQENQRLVVSRHARTSSVDTELALPARCDGCRAICRGVGRRSQRSWAPGHSVCRTPLLSGVEDPSRIRTVGEYRDNRRRRSSPTAAFCAATSAGVAQAPVGT